MGDDITALPNAPPDRYKLIYLMLMIHGVGILMPWNMFITANSYYIDYKFSKNYTGEDLPFLSNFVQYLTFSAQIPNVLVNWANIFIKFGNTSLTYRILWSIIIEIVLALETVTLAMIDSSSWPTAFFGITIATVTLMHMATGIYQNTIFGVAAKLPPKYTGVIVLGNNISGTFTAIVAVFTSVFASDVRIASIYFFITTIFVLFICIDSYYALSLNRFYRFYEIQEKKRILQQRALLADPAAVAPPPYWEILKREKIQLYNVFIVFVVTLSIFPAIHANIVSPDGDDFFIPKKLFAIFTCFLTFNVFAMLGSLLAAFCNWPGPKYLWIFVTIRLIYIPFFLFCNYQVPGIERKLVVLIPNVYIYWVVAATMAFSSGYFSAIAMMFAPRTVEDKHGATAAMFAAAFLITGIFVGVLTTFIWPWVIR